MIVQPKLFSKVRCHAYLKKHHDGINIVVYDKYGNVLQSGVTTDSCCKAVAQRYDMDKGEYVEIADLSEWSGQSVEKTYRIRVEEEFTGFVVGYTRIKVKGEIGTDWCDEPYIEEYGYCSKWIKEYPKVAVVYFKNNGKRYVLPEDMEVIDDGFTESREKEARDA